MQDQKPPRLSGDERSTLLALLTFQRESVIRKVEGLSSQQARWSPVRSATSALWLLNHLADAERSWVIVRFAGRSAELTVTAPDDLARSVVQYVETSREVDLIIRSHDLSELTRAESIEPPVNLRWVLAHLLEETARHAGHLDLITELLDGRTGR